MILRLGTDERLLSCIGCDEMCTISAEHATQIEHLSESYGPEYIIIPIGACGRRAIGGWALGSGVIAHPAKEEVCCLRQEVSITYYSHVGMFNMSMCRSATPASHFSRHGERYV